MVYVSIMMQLLNNPKEGKGNWATRKTCINLEHRAVDSRLPVLLVYSPRCVSCKPKKFLKVQISVG